MKMMTVKANFFNGFAFLIVFAALITACAPTNRAITYTHQFKGQSANGEHTRAAYIGDMFAVFAGQNGKLTVHIVDTTLSPMIIEDSIDGIEDFRDVYLTSRNSCILMNSGENGIIFGIAGASKKGVLYDTAGVFFDGMDFWNENAGIVYGDPIDGKFFLAKSIKLGGSWVAITPESMPNALENEAGFAASGTSIQVIGDSTVYFGTGMGAKARLFCSYDRGANWVAKNTPMKAGDSYGIYSLFFWSENEGIIAGGSYKDSTYKKDVCQYTSDGGDTWETRTKGLSGYVSCVHGTADGKLIVATGRMGTYYTTNKGESWDVLVDRSFYSCFVTNNKIALVGRSGATEILNYTLSNN